jgi:F-box and WD-40 domain protein CDC4
MDPPVQPPRRRSALTQMNTADLPHKCTPEGSPSPFTPNPKPRPIVETRRPRSSQTVSIGWEDSADGVSQSTSRLQIEMAECVETKTVTTTTTTKRSYPPLLVRRQPLSSLDLKEYPLALNPTPPELSKFRYEIDGTLVSFRGNDGASHPLNVRPRSVNWHQYFILGR